MKRNVPVLVLTGFGLNCDHETAHAFELAGATARRVHINSLIDRSATLEDFQILAFGGGFSWGDDHGAGVIQAVRMKTRLGDDLLRFVEAGKLVIGICNGFQTLVNLGLLPGVDGDYRTRSVALTHNDCGNFRDQWVRLRVNTASPCVFTKGIAAMDLPVRHGEGKFYAADGMLSRLRDNQQVVLQYADADGLPAGRRFPANPNGSLLDAAGICDASGRVFGLMPHPEAFHHPTHHPQWTRRKELARRRGAGWEEEIETGLTIFRNAVRHVSG
ncbi:MAG: phosphoribosylformylglycinamidine synthase subunit PurQ [Thermodesulfobacteriota bacterium]